MLLYAPDNPETETDSSDNDSGIGPHPPEQLIRWLNRNGSFSFWP